MKDSSQPAMAEPVTAGLGETCERRRSQIRLLTGVAAQQINPAVDIQLPTHVERTAYLLKVKQGLTDAEIGQLLHCRRETVNRYRASFARKVAQIRLAFPEHAVHLLAPFVSPN